MIGNFGHYHYNIKRIVLLYAYVTNEADILYYYYAVFTAVCKYNVFDSSDDMRHIHNTYN